MALVVCILISLIAFALGFYLGILAPKITQKWGSKRVDLFSQVVRLAMVTLLSMIAVGQIWLISSVGNLATGEVAVASSDQLQSSIALNASSQSRVSQAQYERLSHGVNLSHWFAQTDLTPENFQNRITAKDLKRIKDMGFRHVRLPVDPEILFNAKNPERLNPDNLKYIDTALDQILAQKLGVIVDIHPKDGFKQRLYEDEAFVEAVGKFWQTLAKHLSNRNPELVFLEVMNEPASTDPQVWYTIQQKLLAAMRKGAPQHTLIASANERVGDVWNSIQALEELTPLEDPNVVYNFHFYSPHDFTHQGATWGAKRWKYLLNIPYPSSPEAVAPILPKITNEHTTQKLREYGEKQWDRKKLEELLSRAATWAKANNVLVTCNEFGVYRKVAPEKDRITWLRDVRSVLENYQISWAMWDYNGGFGLFAEQNGKYVPEEKTLKALFDKRS
jgi:aryl-phospho-beta-D-glucosidase BglC (GH1 family)